MINNDIKNMLIGCHMEYCLSEKYIVTNRNLCEVSGQDMARNSCEVWY